MEKKVVDVEYLLRHQRKVKFFSKNRKLNPHNPSAGDNNDRTYGMQAEKRLLCRKWKGNADRTAHVAAKIRQDIKGERNTATHIPRFEAYFCKPMYQRWRRCEGGC